MSTTSAPAQRICQVCNRKFPSPPGKGRPPETCSPKCRERRRAQQRLASSERAIARGIPAHVHGTITGYTFYKCTCARCRGWSARYQSARRAEKKGAHQ